MPNRAQRRSGEPGEFDKMGFRVTLETLRGTEPYEIQLANFSAQDELDFHQTTGFTFFEAFEHMSSYVVAAFIWLERRKYEKRLMFPEVAKEVSFRALETLRSFDEDDDISGPDDDDDGPTPIGSNPERSGGPSGTSSPGSPPSTG
jgi:hypothetical protein